MSASALSFRGTDRFEVIRKLGAGSVGVVYEVFDRERQSAIALKTLQRTDGSTLFRFKKEFRVLANIRHPHLVELYELLSDGDEWFFTMELLRGGNLQSAFLGDSRQIETAPRRRGHVSQPAVEIARATVDHARLRQVMLQLAIGVEALHENGCLHRDIKPSNVLLAHDGRTVLCDFGLIAEMQDDAPYRTSEDSARGTPAYMSPEQAAAQPVSAASDWYSVGAMLFELLTGRPPADGKIQHDEPRAPSEICADVPRDLDELCVALLRRLPEQRPSGPEILARLGHRHLPTKKRRRRGSSALFGRSALLGQLDDAHRAAHERGPVAAVVVGAAGFGKTALVNEFIRRLRHSSIVLEGRCHERESVPYKAFDAIIDALSCRLAALPEQDVAALLPPGIEALARIFPVLKRVDAIATSAGPCFDSDARVIRSRAFTALRRLLANLSRERPVVVFIDDLHWMDSDSAALLVELVRQDARADLLIVISCRSEDSEVAQRALGHAQAVDVHAVRVGPLEAPAAVELARSLLDAADADAAERIATESGGNPLFIRELARHVANGAPPQCITLEEAFAFRIGTLPADARHLLSILALAWGPVSHAIAMHASRLGPRYYPAASRLEAEHLIAMSGVRETHDVEIFHDRIRKVVTRAISDDERRNLHHELANAFIALEASDSRQFLEHLIAAGERDRTASEAVKLAERAALSLAFGLAAQLFRTALSLLPPDRAERQRLATALGDALVADGRDGEAASAFLEAAARASESRALELRRRAAEALLRSGHIDQGTDLLAEVARSAGFRLADGKRRLLGVMTWHRARLGVRGLHYKLRPAHTVSPEVLQRIDLCWSAASGFAFVDSVRALELQQQHLRLALLAGEPMRIARGLSVEAAFCAATGPSGRSRFEQASAAALGLADQLQLPYLQALAVSSRGIGHFLFGDWASARDDCEAALDRLMARCAGIGWEIANTQYFLLASYFQLGDLDAILRRHPEFLRACDERGDRLAATVLRCGEANVRWLISDQPDEAEHQIESALRGWSARDVTIQHVLSLVASAHVDLYRGDAESAWRRVEQCWPAFARSPIFRNRRLRLETAILRAKCGVASASVRERDARLAQAERDANVIERLRAGWWTPAALVIRAAIAVQARQHERAVAHLEAAAGLYQNLGMLFHAAATRRAKGVICGGRERSLVDEAEAWMAARGVRRPDRLSRIVVPLPL